MTSCDQLDTSPKVEYPKKIPNRNIKERLNLHVKRRLQEQPNSEQSDSNSQNRQSAFGAVLTASCTNAQKRGAPPERGAASHGGGRGGKKSKNTKHLTLNVPSASSTCLDDDCSRDGSLSCVDLNRDNVQSPDILTTVLNHKKLSLFHDPEVMKFLEGIVNIIGKKVEVIGGG